jgi:AAA+ superfamily predicted ATPase
MTHTPSHNRLTLSPLHPRFTIEKDLILPAESLLQIQEAMAKIRFHHTIYTKWGFSKVDPMGTGIALNFYGKPGTGKTLAAEGLAGSLALPFLPIGIAELESKFMGDTARNIQDVFALAAQHKALLFFDEADTLLGKRLSNVTQGVDNEVNAARSTLLIELERYEGIVVFATNFAENFDKAFESRISHHVHFLMPDRHCRQQLWNMLLVPGIPLQEDRDWIIENAADHSEGFCGRDIRTCLRLALPKPLLAQEREGRTPLVAWRHLVEAMAQVREAHRNVGTEVNPDKK